MNLKQWKAKLQVETEILCVYRWYWHDDPTRESHRRPPSGKQLCTITKVQTNGVFYNIEGNASKGRAWMDFPKAADLKADEAGFEFLFDAKKCNPQQNNWTPGAVVSRYLWLNTAEERLRALWDVTGVEKERQDELIAEIDRKAQPEYLRTLFQPRPA